MNYSWKEFEEDSKALAKQITENYDILLIITRGGLFLGGMIAELKELRSIRVFNISSYEGRVQIESVSGDYFNDFIEFEGKKVLVIDDIADTGNTLDQLRKLLCEHLLFPEKASIMTLFWKKRSKIKPDFFAREVPDDEWIVFPWES